MTACAAGDDRDDHGQAERPESPALPAQALNGAPTGLSHAVAAARIDRLRLRRPCRFVRRSHAVWDDRTPIGSCSVITRRPRSWTVAIRAATSDTAIKTSATVHAAAVIWWAPLKAAMA